MSDSIKLQVSLVLAERLPRKPVTAWAPGTVLWEESKDIRLEGSGSRFPMNAISFRNSGPDFPSSAAWRLEWDPDDLEVPALGGIRLHVNTDHAWMSRVIASPDDPSSRLVVSMMEFDVTRTLLVGALERDDFVQRKDWPPDSVGKVIERILKLRLREFSALVLQAKLRSSPDTFHALLQDKLGLLQRVP